MMFITLGCSSMVFVTGKKMTSTHEWTSLILVLLRWNLVHLPEGKMENNGMITLEISSILAMLGTYLAEITMQATVSDIHLYPQSLNLVTTLNLADSTA